MTPSSAKKKMSNAVHIPIIVIIICFDFHSFLMVRSVTIEVRYATTMKSAVKIKNWRAFKVRKLVKIASPTNNTVDFGQMNPDLTSFLLVLLFNNFASDIVNALELQIIECSVPKIADKIEK